MKRSMGGKVKAVGCGVAGGTIVLFGGLLFGCQDGIARWDADDEREIVLSVHSSSVGKISQ